jgi:ribosomal protein L37AE/L43A
MMCDELGGVGNRYGLKLRRLQNLVLSTQRKRYMVNCENNEQDATT